MIYVLIVYQLPPLPAPHAIQFLLIHTPNLKLVYLYVPWTILQIQIECANNVILRVVNAQQIHSMIVHIVEMVFIYIKDNVSKNALRDTSKIILI